MLPLLYVCLDKIVLIHFFFYFDSSLSFTIKSDKRFNFVSLYCSLENTYINVILAICVMRIIYFIVRISLVV